MAKVLAVKFEVLPDTYYHEDTDEWTATLRGWTPPIDDDLTTIEVRVHTTRCLAEHATEAVQERVKYPIYVTI